jgi:type IV secretory pathway TrbD component
MVHNVNCRKRSDMKKPQDFMASFTKPKNRAMTGQEMLEHAKRVTQMLGGTIKK